VICRGPNSIVVRSQDGQSARVNPGEHVVTTLEAGDTITFGELVAEPANDPVVPDPPGCSTGSSDQAPKA